MAAKMFARAFALVCLPSGPAFAGAAYHLMPGDIVEMSIAGIQDLHQRSEIDAAGDAALPLVGAVPAAGRTIDEFRSSVRDRMVSKLYRQRTPERGEATVMISPEEVSVSVADYRPIYVNGDVSKPGQEPFRVGMTVRQAVALAGGYDIMRFRMNNPFLESADYNAERESLRAELSREILRSARLEAELDSAPKIAAAAVMDAGSPSQFLAKTLADEQNILELREADYKNDRDSYSRSIDKAQEQLKLLGEQRQKEQEGAQADITDYANIQDIFRKGNTSMLRLTDSRRVMLLSSTRLLQTTVQLAQANRDLETLNREAGKLDQLRRAEIHGQLQDSRLRTKQIESRLAAASEKLAYASLVKSQLVRGDGAAPEIKLVRTRADGSKSFSAGEDDALEPGDVVEVSLRSAITGLVQ